MGVTTRGGITIGLFIAGLAIAATAAGFAGAALKARNASVTLDPGPDAATAQCKKGTKAVSGGFDTPNPSPTGAGGSFITPLVSERTAKRQWSTTGYNYGDADDLVTYAYCSDTLPKLKVKSETVTVGPLEVGVASPTCNKAGEAVSGGFVEPDDDITLYQFTSRRSGKRTWLAAAFNDAIAESRELTALVYCARHKLGLKEKMAATTFDSQDGEVVSKTARCKKGTKAVSGGYTSLTTETQSVESFPFKSRRSGGRKWSAAGFGFSTEGDAIDWVTHIYCLDRKEL
jgi:hypothetical protein